MTDIVEQLRSVSGCTQKTFMHSLDWEEGRKIINDAAAEIERLRIALHKVVARTYSSDRRCRLDYEPVAEICDIASAAVALPPSERNADENTGGGQ